MSEHLVQQFRLRESLLVRVERRVLQRMVSGKSNFQISLELGISLKAVKVHRERVLELIGIKSVLQLIKVARLARSSEQTSPASANDVV